MASRKKIIVWSVIVVVLAGGGYFAYPVVKLAVGLKNKGAAEVAKSVQA